MSRIVVFHSYQVSSPNSRIYHPGHPAFCKFHLATILQDCEHVHSPKRKHVPGEAGPQKKEASSNHQFSDSSCWCQEGYNVYVCLFQISCAETWSSNFSFWDLPLLMDTIQPAIWEGFKKHTGNNWYWHIFTITSAARRILAIKSTLPVFISSFISSSVFWRRGT